MDKKEHVWRSLPTVRSPRTALLAAPEALTALLDAVVLLAAPAVYLHTRHAHFTAPEYTTDADFCVASPDRSGNDRQSSLLSCSFGTRAPTPALTAEAIRDDDSDRA